MKNNTIVLSLLLLFLFPLIVTSQKNKHNSQRQNQHSNSVESIKTQMVKIQEKLNLDGLQAVIVERILKKYADKKKQLRTQSEPSDVLMAKMRDLRLKQNEELAKVLTEEQITLLNKMFKEQKNQGSLQSKKGSGRGSGKGRRKGRQLNNF